MKKNRLIKGFNPSADDYQDFVELFEEDVMDEEIARDMNVDVETVRSIKNDIQEEASEGASLFFKNLKHKKNRRKI